MMKFENEEDKRKFLEDEPFYKNAECFCIGKTFEESAEITKKIIEDREKENGNVGMDN